MIAKALLLPVLGFMPLLMPAQINLPSPTAPTSNGVSISESWTANGAYAVTQYTLVQRDPSQPTTFVVPAASDVLGVLLSPTTSVGSNVTVQIARYGQVLCILDTTGSTAGDLAVMGASTPSYCGDPGTSLTSSVSISSRIVGYFLQTVTAGSGAMALVELTPGLMGTYIDT